MNGQMYQVQNITDNICLIFLYDRGLKELALCQIDQAVRLSLGAFIDRCYSTVSILSCFLVKFVQVLQFKSLNSILVLLVMKTFAFY